MGTMNKNTLLTSKIITDSGFVLGKQNYSQKLKEMKNESNTIFRLMEAHIGQVSVENADTEIERMQKQTGKKWKKDFSQFLDDDDEECPRPATLKQGNCWVIRDYSSL